MASVSRPSYTGPASARRAQMMRDAWGTFAGHSSSMARQVFWFFSAYPPLAQGLYYLLLGLFSLLAPGAYQTVTGHTGDPWVMQVFGVLMLVVGGALCVAAYRRQGTPEVLFIAFGSALGLIGVDIHLVYRGYSYLYLLDAVLQASLVAFWVYGWQANTK